ncbi:MAG: hypothetical protein LBC87_00265 [Fibromonadaceae bacterium]|jgi:hypothetical protein|nr:hypothetical protein [Fibromonadaceae bacterium]
MLMSPQETAKLIETGKVLHIAATEALLKKLPKGNWIGGSTEYFIASTGGEVSNEKLSVVELPCEDFSIKAYSAAEIENVAIDAFDNGFSIVIVPFDSVVHKEYARNAPGYKDIFMKNTIGWIAGMNLEASGQTPIAVEGAATSVFSDKAVAIHLKVPKDKNVNVGVINIFSQDKSSPLITFAEEGFSINKCFVDGKETVFADYIAQNKIDTKLPLVGDYAGNGVNISFRSVENGVVNLYAPVFKNIKYRIAKDIADYEKEFNSKIALLKEKNAVFSCNCILNFLHGNLKGKKIDAFFGPITFGEIAYQLVNQTLTYVTVE